VDDGRFRLKAQFKLLLDDSHSEVGVFTRRVGKGFIKSADSIPDHPGD